MSRFLAKVLESAKTANRGMTTGEPAAPVRRPWTEVHERALRIAGAVREAGLQRGGIVGVLAGDPAAIAPLAQGVWLTGGGVTMLHQPTARTDLATWAADTVGVLRMINASLVVLGPPFDALASVLSKNGVPFRMINTLGEGEPVPEPDPDVAGEDDIALLQLTSGSTAYPKAVRITHRNLNANLEAMAQAARLDARRDVFVSWLPLFHDMGMVGFLTLPMTLGVELVSVTPADFLARPLLWAELISKYHGTVTAAPNFAWAMLARSLTRAETESDLSSLRVALNGAEPIDPATVAAFVAEGERFKLRPESVLCAYGMAETALAVSFAPVETGIEVDEIDADALESGHRALPAGSAGPGGGPVRRFPLLGPPLPGIEARVVGEGGTVRGPREVGMIQLRGDSVTPGYLTIDGPLATQDAEGWFETGDEGYLTARPEDGGQIVVCGRRKDTIIMGGATSTRPTSNALLPAPKGSGRAIPSRSGWRQGRAGRASRSRWSSRRGGRTRRRCRTSART